MDKVKMANNILEFLIDPTVIPVRKRLYFRPEERLQNEFYEAAKADAKKTYGDQKHNSDFYPTRNRLTKREASAMDRKTLIAGFDILAQNFDEKDPIAVDLRAMAVAVEKMKDDEFEARVAKRKVKTFKCSNCGTKVLEQTGYCVKCREKVEPKTEKTSNAQKGQNDPRFMYSEPTETEPTKEESDKSEKKEEEDSLDGWSKEASEAVRRMLISEAEEDKDFKDEEEESEDEDEDEESEDEDEEEESEDEDEDEESEDEDEESEDEDEEEESEDEDEESEDISACKNQISKKDDKTKKTAGKIKGPGIPDGTGPYSKTPKCQIEPKEKDEESQSDKESKIVNTDILATENFAGIDINLPLVTEEDIGELTASERATIERLLSSNLHKLTKEQKEKLGLK